MANFSLCGLRADVLYVVYYTIKVTSDSASKSLSASDEV